MMKLRTAQYNSYNLFDERIDKDIFENVKANTCRFPIVSESIQGLI